MFFGREIQKFRCNMLSPSLGKNMEVSPHFWYITIKLYDVTAHNAEIPVFNDERTRYFLQKKWVTVVDVEM